VADGLQGTFPDDGGWAVSSADGSGRSFPVLAGIAGLQERAWGDGPSGTDRGFSALRSSSSDADGQWLAVGLQRAPRSYAAGCVADGTGNSGDARSALPSANAGEGGTVSSNVEGGAVARPGVRGLGGDAGPVRSLARDVQRCFILPHLTMCRKKRAFAIASLVSRGCEFGFSPVGQPGRPLASQAIGG
jgi:hypothetical protein